MEHSFDTEFAQEYGTKAAILYRNFQYWIAKNKANGKNFRDGRTWTYNSLRALADLFSYMTVWDVRQALKALIDAGILLAANHNSQGYDRTTWYAFEDEKTALKGLPSHLWNSQMGTDKEKKTAVKGVFSHLRNSQMDDANPANGLCESRTPIPNPKPNIKPDNNKSKEIKFSVQERLELDLLIAREKKIFMEHLCELLSPNSREAKTFARVVKYLVGECQARRQPVSIFKDAAEWARIAAASDITNKKGLFVAKVKEQTGFRAQERLLRKSPTKLLESLKTRL